MVSIIGTGIIPFGRHLERSIVSMAIEATRRALDDAAITRDQIGACYFANALGSSLFGDTTLGQNLTSAMGMVDLPVVNVENACTSGSTAFYLARNAILAGECDIALVVGSEKMCVPDFGLINSGATELDTLLGMVTPAGFALRAKRHMHEFGTTPEQLAAVTVKSRQHASLNPIAQFTKPETTESVLASPMIVDPFTRPQCCPIADGAAALILAGDRVAAQMDRAIAIRSAVLTSGRYENPADLTRWHTDYASVALAYEKAGTTPEDVDIVECHDAFSIAEILHYEALGLCERGEGGRFVERGDASLGGKVPVNVSGGLLSRGHPISATGVAQIVELVTQLRQEAGDRQVEDCNLGVAHCMGGDKKGDTKSCTVAVLSR
ncbi:thiolase [Kordiimonas sediminis]|uniref:propanoyl-CoA C-acyltransferase n=1 Tax=Kordiimonas sediminis TaxID=1735581 RepID=A0A919AKM6_9PROT|nr:thiolase family protein [Kordiimonas sediminis]GHF13998.1 thiolase [Kordiimonas sediminis]